MRRRKGKTRAVQVLSAGFQVLFALLQLYFQPRALFRQSLRLRISPPQSFLQIHRGLRQSGLRVRLFCPGFEALDLGRQGFSGFPAVSELQFQAVDGSAQVCGLGEQARDGGVGTGRRVGGHMRLLWRN